MNEIKTAYRSLARRLHGELHGKMPGATERLADINTAYDRLSVGWIRARHPAQRRAHAEVLVGADVKDRLQVALRKAAFKVAFDGARDPATGVYGDPRRATGGNRWTEPRTTLVQRVIRSGADVIIELDSDLSIGRTLAAVPELVLAADGSIEMGYGQYILDFSMKIAAQRVRVAPSRIRTSGETPKTCMLIQPGRDA